MKGHPENVVKSSEVVGIAVKNTAKDDLGKVKEIVLDKLSGQTKYIVLSFDAGFLGLGDKYFAFPWKALHYSPEDKAFILNVDKEKLKNAQGFDKEHWPDMAKWAWEEI